MKVDFGSKRAPLMFCLLISMAMTGCMKPGTPGMRPALDVPPKFSSSSEDVDAAQLTFSTDWLDDFSEAEGLRNVVSQSLESNLDVLEATARLKEARSFARAELGKMLPSLQASGRGSRTRFNTEAIADPQTGITPDQTIKILNNDFSLTGELSWEVDLVGRLNQGRRAAFKDLKAGEADLEAMRLSIAGRTAQAWFSWVEAGQQVALAEKSAASFARVADTVQRRYDRGVSRSLDLRLAQSNSASAASLLADRRIQYKNATTQLNLLLGRFPGEAIDPVAHLPNLNSPTPVAIPSAVLARRPDLSAAQARLVAADLRESVAWRRMLPNLQVTGRAGYSGGDLETFVDPERLIWSIAGGLVQPLFNGGQLLANARAAEARGDAAYARYVKSVLTAFKEVEDAQFADEMLNERVRHLETAARAADAAEKTATDQYSRGLSTMIELLEAQRRSFNANSSLLEAKRRLLSNRVGLYLALGGKFEPSRPDTLVQGSGVEMLSDRSLK